MQCLSPLCQSPDREAAVIVYQKNWHWHHYIWALVLYTAVVPDTYWFMQERTVWPCNALNQREGADKRRSIWSPNGPHDPLSLQQYLPGISRCWFGQGSCTAKSSVVSLAPCSRDKNKYRNRGRCDIGALPEERQQVGGGVATTSQICHLV